MKEALSQQKLNKIDKIPFQPAIDKPAKLQATSSHLIIGASSIFFINSFDDKLMIEPDVQVDGPSHHLNSTPIWKNAMPAPTKTTMQAIRMSSTDLEKSTKIPIMIALKWGHLCHRHILQGLRPPKNSNAYAPTSRLIDPKNANQTNCVESNLI